jgi:hypothetical protein
MEAAGSSEMLFVNVRQTKWCHITEEINVRSSDHCENLRPDALELLLCF